ncbi:arsenate reductase-like glutaredoxin family protein [Deinobacterium chartae]|uniref:Arsenate reductase-like glutaredoxin family protein n=1 Tax=Deinobacterium chartae TaxID=521158 RepID=A0A841I0B2_9DEIO|nr:ArsC/Spx/MgsR family protein [Deinobacterium chartae]MBB6099097.1 arsenate reductase-like glutaredoxin family protein [Deinobacterium chartae]
MEAQIFGIKKSSATRKAERFFKERRIRIHMVDLEVRPIAKGEVTRFAQRAGGLSGLLDTGSKSYGKLGLEFLRISEERLLELVQQNPDLLRLPLVRVGKSLVVGDDEAGWRAALEAGG